MALRIAPPRRLLPVALVVALICVVILPVHAAAQDEDPYYATPKSLIAARARAGFALAGKLGVGIGAPVSDLGPTPTLELELQHLLPLAKPLRRAVGLFLSMRYAQPGIDGDGASTDPRLSGARFSYDVTVRELSLSFGGMLHIDVNSPLLMPYAGAGGRIYLLRAEADGEAGGAAYGETDETQTSFGVLLLGGVELFAGPGALLGELQFGWAPLDTRVLADANLGALSLSVGYRLIF